MNKSTPFRFFFYEAPRYDENGDLVYPAPVTVARRVSEVPLGLRWVRRRLGLRAYGQLIEGCRFRDEILPLPDPVNPLALSATQATAKLTSTTPVAKRPAASLATPIASQDTPPIASQGTPSIASQDTPPIASRPVLEAPPIISQPTLAAAPVVGQPVRVIEPAASSLDSLLPPDEAVVQEDTHLLSVADLGHLPAPRPVEKITFGDEDLLLPTPAKPHVVNLDFLSATVAAKIEPDILEPLPDSLNTSLESPVETAVATETTSSLASAEASLPVLAPLETGAENQPAPLLTISDRVGFAALPESPMIPPAPQLATPETPTLRQASLDAPESQSPPAPNSFSGMLGSLLKPLLAPLIPTDDLAMAQGQSVINPGTTSQTFVLNHKAMSLSGDLWIDDLTGNHLYNIDGKGLSLRRTLLLQDLSGRTLYVISQALAHLQQTFEIKKAEQLVVTIQKAAVNVMGDHYKVTLSDGEVLTVNGDWLDREFQITQNGATIIVASRQLLARHHNSPDNYAIQIAVGFEEPLGLAIVIALEEMEKAGGQQHGSGFHFGG
jgi:uncharacterized protein YxjI